MSLLQCLGTDGGASGATGRHVLNIVVTEHVQGRGFALSPTTVDDLARGTVLKRKPAKNRRVQVSEMECFRL